MGDHDVSQRRMVQQGRWSGLINAPCGTPWTITPSSSNACSSVSYPVMNRMSGSAMASSPKTDPVVRSRGVSWLPAMTTAGMRAHSSRRIWRTKWVSVDQDGRVWWKTSPACSTRSTSRAEDVRDRGLEAVFDVDRALVPPRFRIGLSVSGVAKVRICEVGNAERESREGRGVEKEPTSASRLLDFSLLARHCRARALAINF